MLTNEDRKIIEAEIDRLELGYRNAQERYGATGSRSTDKTMYKYQVLQNALEDYLYDTHNESLEKSNRQMLEQLHNLKRTVEEMARKGDIEQFHANRLLNIIMGG